MLVFGVFALLVLELNKMCNITRFSIFWLQVRYFDAVNCGSEFGAEMWNSFEFQKLLVD